MASAPARQPLPPERLSASVLEVAGPSAPAPVRLMAARGLAPLGPRDLFTALYQLSLDADPQVSEAARETAARLPDRIVEATLRDPLEPVVLDHMARTLCATGRQDRLEPLLLNSACANETLAFLASQEAGLSEAQLEIIASNEHRLLAAPEIVAALYLNPRARMSTVDHAVELCVRNGVRVEGIANYDEIVQALQAPRPALAASRDELDAAFAAQAAGERGGGAALSDAELARFDLEAEKQAERRLAGAADGPVEASAAAGGNGPGPSRLPIHQWPLTHKLRAAMVGTAAEKLILVRDPNKLVALSVIKSPGLGEREVGFVVQSKQVCGEVIRYIANHREWLKSYAVRVGLAQNPKTPIAVTLRLLPHLRLHDLRNLARSKSVPGAVTTAARELLQKRT